MQSYPLHNNVGVRADIMYSGDHVFVWNNKQRANPVWVLRAGSSQFEALPETTAGNTLLCLGHQRISMSMSYVSSPVTLPEPLQLVGGCRSVDSYHGEYPLLVLQTQQTAREDLTQRLRVVEQGDAIAGFHRATSTFYPSNGTSPYLKRICAVSEKRSQLLVTSLAKVCRDGLLYAIQPTNDYFTCRERIVRVFSPQTFTQVKTYTITFPEYGVLEDFDVSVDGALMAFAVRYDEIPHSPWALVLAKVNYFDADRTTASVDVVTTYESNAISVAFSPDGLTVAASCVRPESPYGLEVHIYDVDT